jgi:glucokinase
MMRAADLVGDIGATNGRFAMVGSDGTIGKTRVFSINHHPTIADAIRAYAAEVAPSHAWREAVLAVASPITADQISLTNHPWSFSLKDLRRSLGLKRLQVINDFAAVALSIPKLQSSDVAQIGGGSAVADAPIGVIGPGTGLGVSALIRAGDEWVPVQSEGGHVTMPANTARESQVLEYLRLRFDHVSAERLLSGPGLSNLYDALCQLDGISATMLAPSQIVESRAQNRQAGEAVSMFCGMLGAVARNLALTLGARGGIYVAGGIVPRMGLAFDKSLFRRQFEGRGRFREYMNDIPTFVVTRPLPALLGAAQLLRRVAKPGAIPLRQSPKTSRVGKIANRGICHGARQRDMDQ